MIGIVDRRSGDVEEETKATDVVISPEVSSAVVRRFVVTGEVVISPEVKSPDVKLAVVRADVVTGLVVTSPEVVGHPTLKPTSHSKTQRTSLQYKTQWCNQKGRRSHIRTRRGSESYSCYSHSWKIGGNSSGPYVIGSRKCLGNIRK